jgi:Restriction endonuclease BglII
LKIAGMYSFNQGKEEVSKRYPHLLEEIGKVVKNIDASLYKTKISKEKTMLGKRLYSPSAINKAFKKEFQLLQWSSARVACDYSTDFYVDDYQTRMGTRGAFREMDFIKEKLGVEIQFGKYAFMVYNVCAKMTIFRNLNYIDCGVEIVPVKALVEEMSSGVSYFEQFIWDLENRGVSNIDIPVLILGIDV